MAANLPLDYAILMSSADAANAELQQARHLVQEGRAGTMQEPVTESVRRDLESHQETVIKRFILDDVDWGLHSDD